MKTTKELQAKLANYIQENLEEEIVDDFGLDEAIWYWKEVAYDIQTMAKDIIEFIKKINN